MIQYHKGKLKNGIRVVTENHPRSKAVSIGIWVLTGTRDEKENLAGISHFLEHLVFKGTKTRTAYDIAKSLEALGGDLNAYTTREYTCFHALVLRDHWKQALDVLSDLVSHMEISAKDFKLEKGVILQEIAMTDESLEELIYDEFFKIVYHNHPLGKPILGSVKSLVEMNQRSVTKYYKDTYSGSNLIVAAAGAIKHEEFIQEVHKKLKSKGSTPALSHRTAPGWKVGREVFEKNSEQVHVLFGWPAATYSETGRFDAFIVNSVLGGGMTSWLYQSVREKKGLVYTIQSSLNTYIDAGSILVYAACELGKVKELCEVVSKDLRKLRSKGVSKKDVEMFKTQICGSILLGSDDVDNRMTSLGVNEMVFGKYRSIDEVIKEIESVTADSVNQYIQEKLLPQDTAGVLMGSGVQKLEKWWKNQKF